LQWTYQRIDLAPILREEDEDSTAEDTEETTEETRDDIEATQRKSRNKKK
jgi:hypothetical protein